MKRFLGILIGLLCLLPNAAYAHSGGLAIGFFLLVLSGGLALIVVLVTMSIIGFKGLSGLKQLGAGVIIWLLAFILIASLAIFAWQKQALHERESRATAMRADQSQAEPRSRDSDLKRVACEDNLQHVRTELARKKHSRRDAIIAYEDCAVEHTNVDMADVLLKEFLISGSNVSKSAHCAYLTPVFRQIGKKMTLDLLPLFTKRGLSLDCRDDIEVSGDPALPSWWKETQAENAMSDPLYAAYLNYLQSTGVDLNVDLEGRNLLSYAFSYAHADTIMMLINEKALTFKTKSTKSTWTPLQYWLLRRHHYVAPQHGATRPIPILNAKEIAHIQAQLPELSANEIDFVQHDGQRFNDWSAMPDGGAALFRYLLQHGLTLHIPNRLGAGIFNGSSTLSPEMIKALDQLNDVQLHEVACRKNMDGTITQSLYAEAKTQENFVLIRLLEKRNLSKCQSTY